MVIYNDFYLRRMYTNLIPTFMMNLARIQVDECPKLSEKEPTKEQHSVCLMQSDVRFTFKLEGIISYLTKRLPMDTDMKEHTG